MFDFEKLDVYGKSKTYNKQVFEFLTHNKFIDRVIKDQLRRASLSIMLNIAEGSVRLSKADRRNFFVIVRGSTFECAAVFDFLDETELINSDFHLDLNAKLEELSKMLFAMIRNLELLCLKDRNINTIQNAN